MTQNQPLQNDAEAGGAVYHQKKVVKIILLSLAVICLILAICTFNTPLEFDWFFASCPYFAGFVILCLILLGAFAFSFGEQRDGKVYLTKEGKLDIATPRSYEALKKPAFVRAISRSQPLKGEGLKSFEYRNGCVSILTTKGNAISAPLDQLTWKYSMTKPNGADDWYIYKYTLIDQSGNTVTYYRNHATFDDPEWDDMNMLLSLCGTVNEGKISKMSKKMTKLLEVVDDFDFSNVIDSAVSLASDQVFAGSNKVIDMVKVKLYGKNKKKKSKFRETIDKIKHWTLIGLVALYVLAVLIYNIINLVDYLGDKSEDKIEQIADSDSFGSDVEVEEDESAAVSDFLASNSGMEIFQITFDDGNNALIALQPETGTGAYLGPSLITYSLEIDEENENRTAFVCSIYPENEDTPKFKLSAIVNDSWSEISGELLNIAYSIKFSYQGSNISE